MARVHTEAVALSLIVSRKDPYAMSLQNENILKRHLPRPLKSYMLLFIALCVTVPLAVVIYNSWAYTKTPSYRLRGAHGGATAIMTAVSLFLSDYKRLPVSLNELTDGVNGEMPYVTYIPLDPWGNAFKYTIINSNSCSISSNGPDEIPNTEDDITRMIPNG